MRALITADWHLDNNPRDEYRWGFVEKTLPLLLKEEGVDLLAFLGDVTERKDEHPAQLVNRVVRAFKNITSICPIVCLQGNHDFLQSSHPFFGFLHGIRTEDNQIYWVKTPTSLFDLDSTLPFSVYLMKETLLLPFTHNPERDWEDIDFSRYKWAFAHQCFTGALSESGAELRGVPLSFFPKKLRIVAGDIHRPQTIGQLTYVGSPYTVDFGDDFDPRVLLWDGKELMSIAVDGPQKALVEAPSTKALLKTKVSEGDIVKVRLEINSYDEWPAAKEQVEKWAEKQGVVLHMAQPIIKSAVGSSVKAFKEREAMSDEELLKEYARKRDVNEAFLNTGLKLL